MFLEEITNPVARAAVKALNDADSSAWSALFTSTAELYDDGNKRDLNSFTKNAFGHERFTSIDKVENNGLHIYGGFHSDQWGDFKTYFKFHINTEGKIYRLDIGQADY